METYPNKLKIIGKLVLVSFLLLISISDLFGQFQKKTVMAGGEINIPIISKYEDGSKHYYFNPKVGYFLLDNIIIGLNIESSLYTLEGNRRTELGAGPLIRYYFGKNRFYGFAHFSYLGNLIMFNTAESKEYQSKLQPGIGIGYMLSPNVGIDAFYSYDFFNTNDKYADIQSYTSSSINIGLQIYFLPK